MQKDKGIPPSSAYRQLMRPAKQCRALGSHEDRSLLGHPSACFSFPGGLQVTWHHSGTAVAVCSPQPSSSVPQLCVGRMTTLHFLLPPQGVERRAATCSYPLMNFQQAEKAAHHFLGKNTVYQSCKVTRESREPCFVTDVFSF